jgi:hypothetical protein
MTVGKLYDVIRPDIPSPDSYEGGYSIIDDSGEYRHYHRGFFITLEEFRDKAIDNILN